jgi:hypothetical protein
MFTEEFRLGLHKGTCYALFVIACPEKPKQNAPNSRASSPMCCRPVPCDATAGTYACAARIACHFGVIGERSSTSGKISGAGAKRMRALLKIQLQRELYLPAFVDGVDDLSKSGRGQLCSRFIKLRRIEEINEFGPEVD